MNRGAALIRLGTALAAVLLATSACGSDQPEGPLGDDASSSPSATASTSPSASPSAVADPPPVPTPTDDELGREAFARWFVDAFAYAFATNDPGPINDVAATEKSVECKVCQLFTTYLEQRKQDGNTVVRPSTYSVEKVFRTGTDRGAAVYTVVTKRPAYANVKEDGTVVDRRPADPAYLIDVALRWNGTAYELTGWVAGKKS